MVDMGLIARLRILLKKQQENISGGVPYWGVYSGLLILYPLVYFGFLITVSNSGVPNFLVSFGIWFGGIIWLLSILLVAISHKLKNQFYSSLAVFFMAVYGFLALPFITTALEGGTLRFIVIQEILIFTWPLISYVILALFILDDRGNYIDDSQKIKYMNLICLPMYLGGLCIPFNILLGNFMRFVFLGFEMTMSNSLILIWSYILYPLRHKDDESINSESSPTAQSQAVDALSDMLQEKQFDKDEFTED
ncbi:membrane protein [Streptococcus equinus]|uniref:hypothetical protein n=2 Tax=Streptococcus equinus TaxID=1335 RepID=UPI000F707476|nr:hypothetical protein [Streptococcus equinus]VED93297.1 membrane protein [Streptococcus equinus]VTS91448.1 membrane protein [Streptococcus equinus]